MITLHRINKEIVKPIKYLEPEDPRPVLGAALFPEIFANIAIISKKKTGKTTIIYKILDKCAGRNTLVHLFVSTLYNDKGWRAIRKMLEKKGIEFVEHTSMKEDGVDQLTVLVDELTEEAKQREEDKLNVGDAPEKASIDDILQSIAKDHGIRLDDESDSDEDGKPKKRKEKYQYPEHIIVLDDLSSELKAPSLVALLKQHRHFFSKVIISSQWIHDLLPESLKQMNYWLLMRGQSGDKLEKIYKDADLSLPYDLFVQLYKKATEKPFNFFYIDTFNQTFRKNFNEIYNPNTIQQHVDTHDDNI